LNRLPLVRLGLVLSLALTLAACSGQPASTTWPGLAASDKLAYVASGSHVYAVNLAGDNYGKEAWRFPSAPNTQSQSPQIGTFGGSPAVSSSALVVASEGPTNSYSGVVFGLNPDTGNQIWCLALDQKAAARMLKIAFSCIQGAPAVATGPLGISLLPPSDNRVMDRIVISNGIAYFGLNNGLVYAVEAETGKVKWTFAAQKAVWAAPLVDEAAGLIYVGSLDHNLYALDLKAGTLKWKKDLKAAIASAPAAADGTLYVGTFGSKLLALDALTGAEKWSVETAKWVWDTPVVQDGALYLTDVGGTVYAMNAATGERQWSVKPGDAARAAPRVSAEAVFVGDRAGKLYALNRQTGNLLWPQPQTLKGQLLGTPLLISDTLLLAPYGGDNLLVGYNLDGAQKIAYAPSK
jgi:outer membrane protein assembly factor BamB